MNFGNFKGEGRALDRYDIPHLAYRISVTEDHLQAFLNVESRSLGYDRSGRPVILNEPHVFYRNLHDDEEREEAVRLGLAYKKWGARPYPKTSDLRYEWLEAAMKINQTAALKACSWGSTQILGENFSMVGFDTVQAMVLAFMRDEEEHVEAMVKYILATGIADDMLAERWAVVARVYNGPSYAKNKYDTKMATEFRKLRSVPDKDFSPDAPESAPMVLDQDALKRVQKTLGTLGYTEVGWADGFWGSKTRAGVVAFRIDRGMAINDTITKEFMVELFGAPARVAGETRAEATAADLREAGSRQIAAADGAAVGGTLTTVGGGLAATGAVLRKVEENVDVAGGILDTVQPYMDMMVPFFPWAALGVGGYVVYNAWAARQARVDDHRTGKTSFAGPIL